MIVVGVACVSVSGLLIHSLSSCSVRIVHACSKDPNCAPTTLACRCAVGQSCMSFIRWIFWRHITAAIHACCRAYNKVTSAALTWQTQAPASDHAVSLKEAATNRALKGLKTLHTRVTGSGGHKADVANSIIPQPVAPLPWENVRKWFRQALYIACTVCLS